MQSPLIVIYRLFDWYLIALSRIKCPWSIFDLACWDEWSLFVKTCQKHTTTNLLCLALKLLVKRKKIKCTLAQIFSSWISARHCLSGHLHTARSLINTTVGPVFQWKQKEIADFKSVTKNPLMLCFRIHVDLLELFTTPRQIPFSFVLFNSHILWETESSLWLLMLLWVIYTV